ncbi:hypothetical protein HD554DRAFT_2268729 [Boletus coccyginus]|nr:hypothetical protein HD554DRAFT_2268729 [Boletus coccyginus]
MAVDEAELEEPSGRNTKGKKKTRERVAQVSSKRRASLGSPELSQKRTKRTRQNTLTPATIAQETHDEASSLADAAAALHVKESATPSTDKGKESEIGTAARTPDDDDPMVAHDDPVGEALNLPGGQNSPDEDEAIAQRNLNASRHSSPLSSPPRTQPSLGYSLPHREPLAGTSTGFRAAAHAGDLGKNKDGNDACLCPRSQRTYQSRKRGGKK